jgi:hypothetical protein
MEEVPWKGLIVSNSEQVVKAVNDVVNTLHRCTNNEATRAPYWLIIDPKQVLKLDIHRIASMITGPFFSRKDAEDFLNNSRYNFSKNAKVYCCSGCYSQKYCNLCKELDV